MGEDVTDIHPEQNYNKGLFILYCIRYFIRDMRSVDMIIAVMFIFISNLTSPPAECRCLPADSADLWRGWTKLPVPGDEPTVIRSAEIMTYFNKLKQFQHSSLSPLSLSLSLSLCLFLSLFLSLMFIECDHLEISLNTHLLTKLIIQSTLLFGVVWRKRGDWRGADLQKKNGVTRRDLL